MRCLYFHFIINILLHSRPFLMSLNTLIYLTHTTVLRHHVQRSVNHTWLRNYSKDWEVCTSLPTVNPHFKLWDNLENILRGQINGEKIFICTWKYLIWYLPRITIGWLRACIHSTLLLWALGRKAPIQQPFSEHTSCIRPRSRNWGLHDGSEGKNTSVHIVAVLCIKTKTNPRAYVIQVMRKHKMRARGMDQEHQLG